MAVRPVNSSRKQLVGWLKKQPEGVAIAIANRSAIRVAPIWLSALSHKVHSNNSDRYLILRCLLISTVAARGRTKDIVRAARHAAAAAKSAMGASASAVDSASAVLTGITGNHIKFSSLSVASAAAMNARIWPAAGQDMAAAQNGGDLTKLPIWFNDYPEYFSQWEDAKRAFISKGESWQFWISWLEAVILGNELNLHLLAEVAHIPNEDWDVGADHIDALIAKIRLKYVIAATPNAEKIMVNPDTGLLRLETVSDLPADHHADVLDMLRDAQAVFDDELGGNDPYGAIKNEREVIAKAIVDYSGRPRMLFNSCMRVVRRLEFKMQTGDCPKDALVGDYQSQIAGAANKLLSHDAAVKEAVSAEGTTRLDLTTPDQRAQFILAAEEVAKIAEGPLKEELPSIALIAADPNATPEDRQVAVYQTTSRLIRSWVALKSAPEATKRHLKENADLYGLLLGSVGIILAVIAL